MPLNWRDLPSWVTFQVNAPPGSVVRVIDVLGAGWAVQVPAIGFASIHRPKAVQERLHRSGPGAEGGRLRAPSPYRR